MAGLREYVRILSPNARNSESSMSNFRFFKRVSHLRTIFFLSVSCIGRKNELGAGVIHRLKPCASAPIAWVRSQPSVRSLLDTSTQREDFTCLMTRLSSVVNPVIDMRIPRYAIYDTSTPRTVTDKS